MPIFCLYTYINISKFPKALWSRSIMVRSRIFWSCTIFSHFWVKYSILKCPHYMKMLRKWSSLKYLSVFPKLWFLLKLVIWPTRDVADRAIRIDADRLSSILGWSAHVENYIFFMWIAKCLVKWCISSLFYPYFYPCKKCKNSTLYMFPIYSIIMETVVYWGNGCCTQRTKNIYKK